MNNDFESTPRWSRRGLLGLLAMPSIGIARTLERSSDPLDAALAALVNDKACPLASVSVLVRRAGHVIYEGQFGRRHIEPDLPVTPDTLFRMASVTKLFVAVAAMRLVDAGMLDLDVDIGKLLGYPLRHSRHPDVPISARLLLTHRSGLSDAGDDYLDARTDLRALGASAWSVHAPGGWFEYANLNFALLAAVLERVTGQRFDRLMQAWVFDPLGIQGGFDPARLQSSQLAQVATLYRKAPSDAGPWDPTGRWHAQADDFSAAPPEPLVRDDTASYEPGSRAALFGPQGRLRTRVRDLGTMMAMLLNGGRHEGQVFLQPQTVRALMSESWRANGLEGADANGDTDGGIFQAWGLGMQHFIDRSRGHWGDRLRPEGGIEAWGHLGFAYGLVSGLLVDPRRGCGIAYAISGTGADPEQNPGTYSSFPTWEERLQALLWARALA
ncbi:MAG: beta-lactamase family protein [Paucibacter sp.]|nr:beta-lactamase family protein [Roseateles sp.]